MSGVKDDIPPNGRWGGFFAKPTKQWFRRFIAVERLCRPARPIRRTRDGSDGGSTGQFELVDIQRDPQDAPAPAFRCC